MVTAGGHAGDAGGPVRDGRWWRRATKRGAPRRRTAAPTGTLPTRRLVRSSTRLWRVASRGRGSGEGRPSTGRPPRLSRRSWQRQAGSGVTAPGSKPRAVGDRVPAGTPGGLAPESKGQTGRRHVPPGTSGGTSGVCGWNRGPRADVHPVPAECLARAHAWARVPGGGSPCPWKNRRCGTRPTAAAPDVRPVPDRTDDGCHVKSDRAGGRQPEMRRAGACGRPSEGRGWRVLDTLPPVRCSGGTSS